MSTTPSPTEVAALHLTAPTPEHGLGIHDLVAHTGVLDVNSVYAYLLICRDFADTSLVALDGDRVVGVVTGYIPPHSPHSLFIWQVAVHADCRGRDLAGRMLRALVARQGKRIHRLETTVAPSNAASRRMFDKLAAHLQVPIVLEDGFPAGLFAAGSHEPEPRLVLGPIEHPTDTGV